MSGKMGRRDFGVSCVGATLAALSGAALGGTSKKAAFGQENGAADGQNSGNGENGEKMRILLVVGGHSYDREGLHAALKDCPNSTFDEISIPEKQDMLKPGLSKDYDVVVFHDQSFFELTQEQKDNLTALWSDEGIPTVMLHHSLISHPDFPLFRDVFGAQFIIKETEIEGRVYRKSTYKRPTDVNIYIVDRPHPITEGVKDFKINDEVFQYVYFNPRIDVLARTDHPESDAPVVWTWRYKKTPVFGMIQGDANGAFGDANYRKIFYQGLRWVVDEKKND